jgi:uncharacterized protein involved in outer membrane biogenesis
MVLEPTLAQRREAILASSRNIRIMTPVMPSPRKPVVLLLLAISLVSLFLVARALLDINRYRPKLIAVLEEKTGKPAELGRISLTLFPLAVHIENLALRNTPPFPSDYIVKIARIDARLQAGPLLHRRIVITSLLLDNPVFKLTSDPDGPWNFTTPQTNSSAAPFTLTEITNVQVKNGQLIASNLLPSDAPGPVFFEAHDIFGDLSHVNLAAMTGPASNTMGAQGQVRARRLSFGAVDSNNVSFALQVWAKQVFLADVKAQVCDGRAAGALFFDLTGKHPAFRLNARFQGVKVDAVLEPFENGRGRMTGQMEGDLTLAGQIQHTHRPLAGIRGSGRVTLTSGRVPSLALNANLMRLIRYNDLGPAKDNPASFNRISTDLELADLRITSKTIDIDGYGVDVDGFGSVNVDGSNELDYQGIAQITTKQGFFTRTFARFAGATVKDGLLSFPFRVSGTIDSPVFAKSAHH